MLSVAMYRSRPLSGLMIRRQVLMELELLATTLDQ